MKHLWMGAMLFALGGTLLAQTPAQQQRADGHTTKLLIYGQSMQEGKCAPLAVISHGAGGSEQGLAYLGKGLSAAGWLAITMNHVESGRDAALVDIRAKGDRRAGVQVLVMTPSRYDARLMDVGAALDWAKAHCTAASGIPYKALLGHSMGGITTLLEAGATNKIGVSPKWAGLDRFDAYVPLSAQGPGNVFASQGAFSEIKKPIFLLAGTRDGAPPEGGQWRVEAFQSLPSDGARGCHWAGLVNGATHADMGGNGPGAAKAGALIVPDVLAFLNGARAGKCVLPPPQADLPLHQK
ncbi:MAG: hypothetical protein ABI142_08655 [Bryocella sp.]